MLNFHSTTSRFGSGSTIIKARGSEPITFEQIERDTPSVFAQGKHDSRSDRYAYIDSRAVLTGLIREGFAPFEVRQGGSRDEQKRGFTKHMIRLRHTSKGAIQIGQRDQIIPEVILLNSHDGTSSYRMIGGMFRIICTNGLIAGDAFDEVRVPHTGAVVDTVIEGAFRVIESFPAMVDASERWSAVRLSADEERAYARSAALLRWEPKTENGIERDTTPIPYDDIVSSRRPGDQGNDLWRVFNRTQENLVRGGQHYVQRNEQGVRVARRTVREVNGIDQNRHLNRALWTLTEEMARLKA